MRREKFSDLLIELKAALSSMQLSAASEIAARMQRSLCVAPEDVSLAEISAALKQLRAKRLFGPLEATAEAYFQYAQPAWVRYQYAQALVDQDQVTAALCMVEALLVDKELPGPLAEEVRGLRARAYKQAFVRAADAAAHQQAPLPQHAKEALRLSIDAYQHAYNCVFRPT